MAVKSHTEDEAVVLRKTEKSHIFAKKTISAFVKEHKTFRDILLSGNYVLINHQIVLLHPNALTITKRGLTISEEAIENPDLYCLSYSTLIEKRQNKNAPVEVVGYPRPRNHIRKNTLHKDIEVEEFKGFTRADKENEVNKELYSEIFRDVIDRLLEYVENGDGDDKPHRFPELFSYFMKQRKMTAAKLHDKTGISLKTINRMMNNADYNPSLEYIVICCIAMKLLPWESAALLHLSKHHLNEFEKIDRAYIALLFVMYANMDDCEQLLSDAGVPSIKQMIDKKSNIADTKENNTTHKK